MEARYLLLFISNIALINCLTDPLPDEEGKLMHEVINCAPGKEFQWEKTDSVANDMKISYKCGGGNLESKTFGCKKPNFKASYKRDEICDPGPEPNFGIFREGKDPNVMDTARIIYYCMKVSKNGLPKCTR